MALLYYLDHQNILIWAILACFFHELGHLLAIIACGGKVEALRFTVVGAEMTMPAHFSYPQEFLCALSGPFVNFLLAGGFSQRFPLFAGLNLALALLNLLPMGKLDGGRALNSLLSLCLPFSWKDIILSTLDWLISAIVLMLGVIVVVEGGSISLFILGVWLLQSISS